MPLPSLMPEQPPAIQLKTRKAVRASWADPDDMKPNAARAARSIAGHRAFCPLRWCIARHGERASFTADHVAAADALRAAWDGARIGFSSLKDWRPVTAINYRPAMGPTVSALKQLKCRVAFDRAWSLFDDATRAALVLVVLRNTSISKAAEVLDTSASRCKERLVIAFDRLVLHLDIGRERQAAA
jgi:hypothetical protein